MKRRPIISFATSKGGSGKTTALILLAGYIAHNGGRVAVIDTDPSKNLWDWTNVDGRPDNITPYDCTSGDRDQFFDSLEEASQDHHMILIDVQGAASLIGDDAMSQSNLVVVPIQPSKPDAVEAAKTIKAIRATGRSHNKDIRFALVMNRLAGAIRTRAYFDVVEMFKRADINIAAHLHDREAYRRMLIDGGTVWELDPNKTTNLQKAKDEAFHFSEKLILELKGDGSKATVKAAESVEKLMDEAKDLIRSGGAGETLDEATGRLADEAEAA